MNRETVEKAKVFVEHPIMAAITTFTIMGGALTMFLNVSGIYDAAHTSEAELAIVDQRVSELSVKSTCENLTIRITLVEQAIWQMHQQSGANSQRLVEKQRELKELEAKYRSLDCARILK
jgi:hypothetical protein